MKSAQELRDETDAKFKSADEQQREAMRRAQEKAARAQARASMNSVELIGQYPVTTIIIFIALVAFGIFAIEDSRSERAAANDAWYRANLDCRLSGGTYEYFGTQGYHCIGGKR